MSLTAVALCMDDFILTGQMKIEQGRLIDLLNTTMDSLLVIQDPTLKPLHGSPPKFTGASTAVVSKNDIVLAIPLESQEVLQRRAEQRLANYQPKTPCPAFVSIPPYRILGSMHLQPGTSLPEALVGPREVFLAMTSIQAIGTAEAALTIPAVAIVNRAKVTFACLAG